MSIISSRDQLQYLWSGSIFFAPKPEEVVGYYLRRRIGGDPTGGAIAGSIHEAEIYACGPDKLTATYQASNGLGEWFFFCHCSRQSNKSKRMNRRDAEGGTWLLHQVKKAVTKNGLRIGYRQNFRYVAKNGSKTDWLMEEYGVDSEEATAGDRVLVICKIYKTPRAHDLQESSTICSKRSAEEEIAAESSTPKRARVASPAVGVGEISGADEHETDADVAQDDDDFASFLESTLLAQLPLPSPTVQCQA